MNNEEQVFDFMAAAEDTGRRLDALIKAFPNEIRETLVAEYRKSPWLATLPTAADRMIAAAERAESASALLTRKTRIAGWLVCVATVILPLSTWALAYWQTARLREESTIRKLKWKVWKRRCPTCGTKRAAESRWFPTKAVHSGWFCRME